MKNLTKQISIIVAGMILFAGCTKENDNKPSPDLLNFIASLATMTVDKAASDDNKTVYNFTFPDGLKGVSVAMAEVSSTTAETTPVIHRITSSLNSNTLTITSNNMQAAKGVNIQVAYTITYEKGTSTAKTSLIVPFTGAANNELGGVYYQNGIATGMIYIANNGTTGTGRVVSLVENNTAHDGGRYGTTWGPDPTTPNQGNPNILGCENMCNIYEKRNNTFDGLSALKWVYELNPTGTIYTPTSTNIWYLPAICELKSEIPETTSLHEVFNDYGKTAFNNLLTSVGGAPLSESKYWSSTEWGSNVLAGDLGDGIATQWDVFNIYRVRAILAF